MQSNQDGLRGSGTHAFNSTYLPCSVCLWAMPLPGYYTLLLQEISFRCTEQRECVRCDNIRGDTQVEKKKRKQPFNITHVLLFLRSLRFRGDDRCHRPRYHHPSGLSADHPEDIQQVGPHFCCWQDNSWRVNYTSRETDNRAIFILLEEDQTPAFSCLIVCIHMLKACEYKQSCIQTYSYKRLKWRPIHSKTSQVACAS